MLSSLRQSPPRVRGVKVNSQSTKVCSFTFPTLTRPSHLSLRTWKRSYHQGYPYPPYYLNNQSVYAYPGYYTSHFDHPMLGIGPKHGTTILSVRKGNKVTVIGDGQITHGSVVMKHNAVKVRRVGNVLVGVAGSAADALTLLEKFEKYLEESGGELLRAVVNLAKQWRVDRTMYRLHATMCMSDKKSTLLFDGEGNVIEPDDQRLLAIGSGGYFALAAARALLDHSNLDAEQIAREAMTIAADLCIHTNKNFTVQTLEIDSPTPDEKPGSPPFV